MKVSVIIPVFNEEADIGNCLKSLLAQTYKDIEVIIIDDGSTDKTQEVLSKFKIEKLKIFKQEHLGPGLARNKGVKKSSGEILVFVDADMTFDKKFIEKLIEPIIKGRTIGTFSKQEYVRNKDNVWAKCWNINKNLPLDMMHSKDYPNTQNVFRAVLKKEFLRVGGFDPIGYIDDHSLAEKLQTQSKVAPGAIFYHKNPSKLAEVYKQARWIGKSEFKKRKIKSENFMRVVTIIRYSVLLSLLIGLYKSIKFKIPHFFIFKIIYDCAIEASVLKSFFSEQKYK